MIRTFMLWLLALFFVAAGCNHFRMPQPYLAMMPPWLPRPEWLNEASGAAEIIGGLAVLIPALRRAAGWGLIVLLVAVFPANVQVALHGWPGYAIPAWILWARLPWQGLFMAWVGFACLSRSDKRRTQLH
jgi:uncharacterized membrane protein